ncbi:MAG: ABC transporter permease [Patescibacteria group bacterium]|jgi:lipopolysaccharide transport system permease protein
MKTVITPQQHWYTFNYKELNNYRDLFYFLAWRDIKVRYKQTAVGVLWAFFVPFISMVVFTIFFGNLVTLNTAGIPYPIFVFVGLLFWTFFSQAVTNASNSLVSSQDIIKKIYFPKVLLPAASILVTVFDFFIAALILIGMLLYYHITPNLLALVIVPLLMVITYITAFSLGLFLAALNVKYRDVRYVIPFFVQILLFFTPVIYPTTTISSSYQWILQLNPMSTVIETARTVLLSHSNTIAWQQLFFALLMSIIVTLISWLYFKKTERYFADII